MKKLALLLLLSMTAAGPAQPQNRLKLKFDCTCTDPVGARYATAVRDALARSPRYEETGASKIPGTNVDYWVISAVSVAVSGDNNATAVAVVFKIGGTVLGQFVQVCGTNKVDGCASDTISQFDSELTAARDEMDKAFDEMAKQVQAKEKK